MICPRDSVSRAPSLRDMKRPPPELSEEPGVGGNNVSRSSKRYFHLFPAVNCASNKNPKNEFALKLGPVQHLATLESADISLKETDVHRVKKWDVTKRGEKSLNLEISA